MTPLAPGLAALGRFRIEGSIPRLEPHRLAALWRGAIAAHFKDQPEFHGHDGDRLLYRHPEVHYRWTDGAPELMVFGPSAQPAMAWRWPGTPLRFGEHEVRVLEVQWRALPVTYAPAERLLRYRLRAPWVALNQDNHARYRAGSPASRRTLLDRVLVGNLVTLADGLGVPLDGHRVLAAFEPERRVTVSIKSVAHLGFDGSFVANLDLSDGLALGRSVSHGFGCFERADDTPGASPDGGPPARP